MRLCLAAAAAALLLAACGSPRAPDGRLAAYRYVVIERAAQDQDPPKGDLRAELADVFAAVGFQVIDAARAAGDRQVAGETLQAYARVDDGAFVCHVDLDLRDYATGLDAYQLSTRKKGPACRQRLLGPDGLLVRLLRERYGGFSQREADLKAARAAR